MKAENLIRLKENGFPVPRFITVSRPEEIRLSFSEALLFAVRSSGAAEDADTQSYAGQFLTLLNVRREDVPAAVKRVLESAESAGARDYAESFGKADQNGSSESTGGPGNPGSSASNGPGSAGPMRVIIQEMVASDLSGVMFTANPMGPANEAVIVAGSGLGDGIVDDRVDVTTYYFDRHDRSCCHDHKDGAPYIDESILYKLITMGEKIEALFGAPMDIEYAVAGHEIYILQARPITTIDRSAPAVVLDNSNIVESYPGVTLPLTQSFVKDIYYRIFRSLILRLTDEKTEALLDPVLRNMVEAVNGAMYYRIGSWYDVLSILPASGRLTRIWQEMLGVTDTEVVTDRIRIPLASRVKVLRSVRQLLARTPALMQELNTCFADAFPRYEASVGETQSVNELLALFHRVEDDLLSRWDVTLINDMYAFLYTFLANKTGAGISGIHEIESMKPVLAMERLIRTAHENGMESSIYGERRQEYIAHYGDRCMGELKLETKTYRTSPELLDAFVRAHLGDAALRPTAAPERKKVNLLAYRAKRGIYNREISRLNRSRIFGFARTVMRKIGGQLYAEQRLEAQDDIFYLTIGELSDPDADFRERVRIRKTEYAFYQTLPVSSRLLFYGAVTSKPVGSAFVRERKTGGALSGTASSPGIAEGVVLVIDTPSPELDTAGRILVTRMTDPGWVFLIRNCAGIIAEKGSILSHTAIISRELGKPSVVNVKDAVQILKTGDTVRLDGYTGIITVLKRA